MIPHRLEVWNRVNTSRRAVFATTASAERFWKLGAEETLSSEVAANDAAVSSLTGGAVLRLQREGSATEFSLWRLRGKEKVENGRKLQLKCTALWMDLAEGRVFQAQAEGRRTYVFGLTDWSPTAWLTQMILPAYAGDALTFAVGVVEPTAGVDLMFEQPTSPLAAARMLEAATQCELQFRYSADGHTCYVDLLQRVGAAAGGVELREGKNIASIQLLEEEGLATRLYPRGGGMLTLADATWTVATTSGSSSARVLTFNKSPVFEDNAYTTAGGAPAKYFYVPGEGPYLISASAKTAGTITVLEAAYPALAPGDTGYLATDMSGSRLDYLESPSALAAYGVRVGEDPQLDDVPDARNLVPGGSYTGTYVAGLAPQLTKLGTPTVSESTSGQYATVGAQCQHVSATQDGDGYKHAAFTVPTTETLRPYLGLMLGVTVISGKVRIEARHSNGSVYPIQQQISNSGLGIHIELSCSPLHNAPMPAGTIEVAVVAHGGAAEWYADYLMVTPQVGSDVPGYVADQGAWLLFDRTAAALADAAQPKREYSIGVVDLYQVDASRYPFERIGRGDTVKLRHSAFPAESLRVVELTDDPVRGVVSRVALAANARVRPQSETDPYLPTYVQRRRPRAAPLPEPYRAAVIGWKSEYDSTDGKAYVTAIGNALTATLQLYTKTTRAGAYPGSPTATLSARQGTFAGITVASGGALFYKVVPLDGAGVAGDAQEDVFSRADGAPPTLEPRRQFNATATAADVYVKLDSRAGERGRLAVKDSEAAGAAVWRQCVASGNATAVWNSAGTEVDGTSAWFTDGAGNYAQKLAAISLAREQIVRVYLQGEAENTGLKSVWVPLALESKQVALLESVDMVWDEGADKLVATAAGGTFCQSVKFDVDDDPNFGSPATVIEGANQSLTEGNRVTVTVSVSAGDRNKLWYLRVTAYNGPLVGGVPSGFANPSPSRDSATVPASESGAGIQPPTASIVPKASTTRSRVQAVLTFSGAVGAGGTGNAKYRYREIVGEEDTAWPGSFTTPGTTSFSADVTIARHEVYEKRVELWVEDGGGRSSIAAFSVAAAISFVDDTGFGKPAQMGGGTFPTGVRATSDFKVGDGGVTYPVGRHATQLAGFKDADTITWPAAYEATPQTLAVLVKGKAPAAGNRIETTLVNVTTTGATVRSKEISGSSSTAYTEYFASSFNGTEDALGIAITSQHGMAYSSLDNANTTSTAYKVGFAVNTTSLGASVSLYVLIYYNTGPSDNSSWQLAGTKTYASGQNISLDEFTFTRALGANYDIRIEGYTSSGTGIFSLTGKYVKFDAITAGTETQAAVSGTSDSVFVWAWEA